MKLNLEAEIKLSHATGTGFDTDDLAEAYEFCKSIALGHYENFPVGSILIKSSLRKHFFAVYSFSRVADDLADETSAAITPDERTKALNRFEALLSSPSSVRNPIFLALRDTMNRFAIPREPFSRLVEAFRRDVDFRQAETWDGTIDYCRHSANPVGEIVLRLFGAYSETTAPLSDAICTGLQLVNFWQDFSRDLPNNRFYIPLEILRKHGVTNETLMIDANAPIQELIVNEICEFSRDFFDRGKALVGHLNDFRLRMEIAATIMGGQAILKKVYSSGKSVFSSRPSIGRLEMAGILLRSLCSSIF